MPDLRDKPEKRFTMPLPSTKTLIIIGGILFAVVAAVAGFFTWQYIREQNDPQAKNAATVARIKEQIGKIYQLPSDEEPQVAQLSDEASKLHDQEFYASAESGDFVLTYPKAQLALLYREKDHKLINVDHAKIDSTPAKK